jgi:bleomycin hydrolase
MAYRVLLVLGWSIALAAPCIFAQPRGDRAVYVEAPDDYLAALKERAGKPVAKAERVLKMDFSGWDLPRSEKEFQQVWHTPPVCQDLTGSCWSFSSMSFFESEAYRLTGRKVKLSEIYMTYWEYVEKARRFIRQKGDSVFSRGSEANAATRLFRQYGVVPWEAYPGKCPGEDFYNDTRMFEEMKSYLQSVEERNAWNEDGAIAAIRAILDRYIGPPPEKFSMDGIEITPRDYLRWVLGIDPENYVDVMSLMQQPFGSQCEYPVDDNCWHSEDYWNLPLKDFIAVIRNAVRKGFTVCIVGDNSEPGFVPAFNAAAIPSFDIPSEGIDDAARQLRFTNGNTTDDHAIHLVGYLEKSGQNWYLIKDSATRAQNAPRPGYMFYHEDFVKLKMMNLMVHRDALDGIVKIASR